MMRKVHHRDDKFKKADNKIQNKYENLNVTEQKNTNKQCMYSYFND